MKCKLFELLIFIYRQNKILERGHVVDINKKKQL